MNTKWDTRFVQLAALVASWSKDPSTSVGAVVTKGNRIVSLGFNGFPQGTEDDPSIYQDRERKYRRVLHAEQNAILFAMRDLTGCTIYVTHAPCARCTAQVIQAGITRIVCPNPWADAAYIDRWRDDVLETQAMCGESDVKLEYLS